MTPPTSACIAIFAMLISCSISYTPLHWASSHGHVAVVQLLLSCNAAVGTEVEPLLVGVPGNYCLINSRLRFDDCLLVPPDTTGKSSSHSLARLPCSSTSPFSSSAGYEGHPLGCSRTCEVVVVSSVSHPPHPPSTLCFKNFLHYF